MLYLKYLTGQSGYAYEQGCIPVVMGEAYPETLADFQGAEIIADAIPDENAELLYEKINQESGLLFASDPEHVAELIQSAKTGEKSFDALMQEWNQAWNCAQEKYIR